MSTTQAADWDMTSYFAAHGDAAWTAFRRGIEDDLAELGRALPGLGPIEAASLERWEEWLVRFEQLSARNRHLGSYLGCMAAADARDAAVQADVAWQAGLRADIEKVLVGLRTALRDADEDAVRDLLERERLQPVAFFLRQARTRALFSMGAAEEGLAADLGVDGIAAWGRLYDQISGSLEFAMEYPDGRTERLPVSRARSLMGDPDPAVREGAFRAANEAWESRAESCAAALNAIAGTRLTLYERRGIEHFLDAPCLDNHLTRRTLSTMIEVARERAEVARAILRERARRMGKEQLSWADLEAPLPGAPVARISYDDAARRIADAFHRFYPDLGHFAEEAVAKRWIDYQPRPGKRPGGFCSSSPLLRESRIFMTFDGAIGDVSTLAHELGHAWHSRVMAEMRPWARGYPMTLAETASTFAEQVLIDRILSDGAADPAEKEAVLDGRLSDATQFILNTTMRFTFEAAFHEERAAGEVSAARLCELMRDHQREWYGDTIAEDAFDPWFWASKLHFYISGLSFYNFPYTFGFLFSQAIFARAKEEGAAFLPRYEALLRDTASATAEDVAHRHLGADIEAPEFWNASIDLVAADLEKFTA